jgi:hypothetical protein
MTLASRKDFSVKHMLGLNKLWGLMAAWLLAGLFASSGVSSAQAQTHPLEAFAETTSASKAPGAYEAEAAQSHADTSSQKNRETLDNSKKTRQHQIVLMTDTFWLMRVWEHTPLSLSVRYHMPFRRKGLGSSWTALELGVDLVIALKANGSVHEKLIFLPAEFFWGAHFIPNFAAYLKVGIGLSYLYFRDSDGYGMGLPFPIPIFQLGLMWNVSKLVLLRLETGFPGILRVGLGFGF